MPASDIRCKAARKLVPFRAGVVAPAPLAFKVKTQTSNRINFVFPPVNTSSTALIHARQAAEFAARSFVLPESGDYSDIPLLTAEEISGLPEIQLFGSADEHDFTPLNKGRAAGKAFHEASNQTNTTTHSSGTGKTAGDPEPKPADNNELWECILQTLQPPIDFDFPNILELPPRHELRPYQWEGIKRLSDNESFLLGDDMGTGKTVQSILACRLLYQRERGNPFRALFVAPNTVIPQWVDEFNKWAPSLTVAVVQGDPSVRKSIWRRRQTHVWLTTYGYLRNDFNIVKQVPGGFDLAVIDEAQNIKSPEAKRTKTAKSLGAISARKWALTGTPVENSERDLETIFDFVKPGLFKPDTEEFKLKSRLPHGEIIKPFFLRRRIEDVIEHLPRKEEIPIWLHFNEKQQVTYNKMERDRVVQLQGQEINARRIITLIGELKKICNRDPVSGESVKIDWLKEKLRESKESDNEESGNDKFLVFTQYRQEQCGGRDYISAKLPEEFGALKYGGTKKANQKILRDFQNNPESRVFIGHPKVAGVGLNQLTVANQVVHFDHWWNPQVTNQATARAYRPGQQSDTVIVYHLWVKNTIEELVWQKTKEKLHLFEEVIDRLSTTQMTEVYFGVFDDLLKKHGFASLQATDASYTPREFEEEVCRVFSAMGYNTQLTPQSSDGGVDVIATKEVGSSVEKIAIQCKHQKAPVSRPACQQLLGVVSGDTTYSKGIMVTTSTATGGAEELIRKTGNLQFINGAEFESLRKKYLPSD